MLDRFVNMGNMAGQATNVNPTPRPIDPVAAKLERDATWILLPFRVRQKCVYKVLSITEKNSLLEIPRLYRQHGPVNWWRDGGVLAAPVDRSMYNLKPCKSCWLSTIGLCSNITISDTGGDAKKWQRIVIPACEAAAGLREDEGYDLKKRGRFAGIVRNLCDYLWRGPWRRG